jgi:uncharacterized protein (TIGR02300 family)
VGFDNERRAWHLARLPALMEAPPKPSRDETLMEDVIDARGTKRTCQSCAGRFYDLNKDPIECPLCGSEYSIASAPPTREPDKPKVEAEKPKAEEEETKSDDDVELVSLEDAEVDVDDDDDADDDTFLEDDEGDTDNVVDIVPSKDGDDDT